MAKKKSSTLNDLIAQMQSMQANQEEENKRLRRRVEWLENRRREFFDIMSANSSDLENRRRLEETERQLDEIQALVARSESELKTAMQDLRQRIITLRNEDLAHLEQEAKTLRERREHIRNHLLPPAMAQVTAFQEEEEELAQRSEELVDGIRQLNEIDLSTFHQSKVA